MHYSWTSLLLIGLVAFSCMPEGRSQATQSETDDAAAQKVVLVNQTDSALVYLAFHPKTARPLQQQIEVNMEESPSNYVAVGDTAALWDCTELDAYEEFDLHLYSVAEAQDGSTRSAHLRRSVTVTEALIEEIRQNDCRLVIDAW